MRLGCLWKMRKRTQHRYGQTFLTSPRWVTCDEEKAENSFFVWGKHSRDIDKYTLSLVGVINGVLNKIGLVLCIETEVETKLIKRKFITKKWW